MEDSVSTPTNTNGLFSQTEAKPLVVAQSLFGTSSLPWNRGNTNIAPHLLLKTSAFLMDDKGDMETSNSDEDSSEKDSPEEQTELPTDTADTPDTSVIATTADEDCTEEMLKTPDEENVATTEDVSCVQGANTSSKFFCQICGKSFNNRSNMTKHQRLHAGIRKYQCEVCLKQFTDKSNLNKHARIHNKTGQYTCDVCERSFNDPSNLAKHRRTHSTKKVLTCETCKKTFSDPSDLSGHRKQHKGKKAHKAFCQICNKHFYDQSYLTKHMRIHRGEMPFSCEICSKKFRQMNNLKKHLMCHIRKSGLENKCTTCSKEFECLADLKKHMLYHTSTKEETKLVGTAPVDGFNDIDYTDWVSSQSAGTENQNQIHICKECGEEFTDEESLEKHSEKPCEDSILDDCEKSDV